MLGKVASMKIKFYLDYRKIGFRSNKSNFINDKIINMFLMAWERELLWNKTKYAGISM